MIETAAELAQGTVRDRTRQLFFVCVASILLVLVLIAFSRTFYLRPFTGIEDRLGAGFPLHLLFHGVALTAWFVTFVVQTALVYGGRVRLHRRLGGFGIFVAALVVVSGVQTIYLGIQRSVEQGLALSAETGIVIGGFISVLFFVALIAFALKWRRHADTHKRLMLFASLSIMGPAFGGAGDGRPLGEFLSELLPSGVLFDPYFVTIALVLSAVVIFDYATRSRICTATLLGGGTLITEQILASTISRTEFGEGLVRLLA